MQDFVSTQTLGTNISLIVILSAKTQYHERQLSVTTEFRRFVSRISSNAANNLRIRI